MAMAVWRRHFNLETQFQSLSSPSVFCSTESGNVTRFSRSIFLLSYHYFNTTFIRRTSWLSLEILWISETLDRRGIYRSSFSIIAQKLRAHTHLRGYPFLLEG